MSAEGARSTPPGGNIPRGLISRTGVKVEPTQRLPSLRSQTLTTLSTPSLIATGLSSSQPASSTTKGGATKRTFKPTIPTRRSATGEGVSASQPFPSRSSRSGSGDREGRVRGKGGRGAKDKDKKLIQLEPVFGGINAAPKAARDGYFASFSGSGGGGRGGSSGTHSGGGGGSGHGFGGRVQAEEIENSDGSSPVRRKMGKNKSHIEKMLYNDKFIDDDSSDEEEVANDIVVPKGWDKVCGKKPKRELKKEKCDLKVKIEKEEIQPVQAPNIFTTSNDQDKMLLFQLPELILGKSDGHIGKIRVYKSGRMEYLDTETGQKFDLITTEKEDPDFQVSKKESSPKKSSSLSTANDITQNVVTVSADTLTNLGQLDSQHIVIAVPQIDVDSR